MSLPTVLAALVAVPAALPLLIWTAEVVAGLMPWRGAMPGGTVPRFTVLIPAHDEAAGIGRTIAALRADDVAVDLLVVADNCRDDTAAVARTGGARVVERHDPARRGKGYALAFGRDALAADPPACVIILDADCAMSGGDLRRLAAACIAADRAIQGDNLQRRSGADASAIAGLSDFAFVVKNLVRQRGMMRLGGVAALTGTGMAIPWADLAAAPLASDALAEDLALGIWLTRRGRAPRYAPVATVWSEAAAGGDLVGQRRRWEHGFVGAARRYALPLLAVGIGHGSRALVWLGCHLLVPPLALLVLVSGSGLVVSLLLVLAGASVWPAALLALLLAAATIAVLAAWWRFGRAQIAARALLAIPGYVAAKLPIYGALLRGRRDGWRRTRRPGED